MTHLKQVLQYARSIKNYKIKSGRYTRLAVERFLNDFKRQKEAGFPYCFDEEAFNEAVDFAQCLFIPDMGKNLELFPFQKFIYANIWGWKYKDNKERRRYRTAYIEIARKNSKTTTFLFPFILYDFLKEKSAESYMVSANFHMSEKSFQDLTSIIQKTKELKDKLICKHNRITYDTSRISFFSSDTHAIDSYKNSFTVVDEYHSYLTDRIITAFKYGGRARLNSTVCIITSAGNETENNPCYAEHMKACNILDGVLDDDSYFTVMYAYDKKDDWKNPDNLIKANPAIGCFLDKDILKSDLNDALITPSHVTDFKSKTCGIWNTHGITNWLDLDYIESGEIEIPKGGTAFAAVDFSYVSDLTAYTLCFPLEDGRYYFKHKVYMPEDTLNKKVTKNKNVSYQQWVEQGYLTITKGAAIDYDVFIEDFLKDVETYNLSELSYDKWNATIIINKLNSLKPEITYIDFSQSLKNMAPATKNFERKVLEHRIIDTNPIARWCLSNVVIRPDSNNNYKPEKVNKDSELKIDTVITSIMALERATAEKQNNTVITTVQDFSQVLKAFK